MEEKNEKEDNAEPKHEVKSHAHETKSTEISFSKKSMWMGVAGALFLLLIISMMTKGFGYGGRGKTALSTQDASKKAVDFINENLLQAGTTASVKSVEEESNLYKVKL